MLAPTSKSPEEREFVVDSGASMCMLSKKVLISEELETLQRSRTPHAALRAHLSCCKVSSCVLSKNKKIKKRADCARAVHTFEEGPFLSRIFMWCQVPLENLMACFDPNLPGSRRIDFLG